MKRNISVWPAALNAKFPTLSPGTFWSTRCGNIVYKVIEPADDDEYPIDVDSGYYFNELLSRWRVLVVFDTYSRHAKDDFDTPDIKEGLGTTCIVDNENLVPFDVISMGLLWDQVRNLSEEMQNSWKSGE